MCFCCCCMVNIRSFYCIISLRLEFLMEGGQKPKCFSEKRVGCVIVKKFRFDSMFHQKTKCLRLVSDSIIQICEVKVVCMLLGYLLCFKVLDQIKFSINESLITLDIGQWILILKSNVSLECIKCFRIMYCG